MLPFAKLTPSSQATPSPLASEKLTSFPLLSIKDDRVRLTTFSLPFLLRSKRSYFFGLPCADAAIEMINAITDGKNLIKRIVEVKKILCPGRLHLQKTAETFIL